MAKIDTSGIEGYADMTAEQKLAALEAYEIPAAETAPANNDEINRLKTMLSKSNSEAADWKRQFRERQSEDERKEAERLEREQALNDQLAALQKEKTVATYRASYTALGYDADMAAEAAEAMANNDIEKVFAIQAKANENTANNIRAEIMKSQPGLTSGAPAGVNTNTERDAAQLRKYFGL